MLRTRHLTRVLFAQHGERAVHSSNSFVHQVTCCKRYAVVARTTPLRSRGSSARFTAPPNVGPGRTAEQEETNPYKSWSHLSHKWLLLTCAGCLCAGLLAGQFADVDESRLRPKFRKEDVVAAVMKQFDFRPDLAASSIRLSFVLAARRAGVQASSMNESCSVVDGLHDVAGVVNYLSNTFNASVEDITSLMAIAAIKFLGGPYEKVYDAWRWGRNDSDVALPSRGAIHHPPHTDSRADTVSENTRRSVSHDLAEAVGESTTQQQHKSNNIFNLPFLSVLHALGNLSVEECVALMACHSVGEFHEHVSGVERASHIGSSYRLSNEYYNFLLKHENALQPYTVSRSEENKQVAELPSNLLATCITASGTSDARRQIKKGRLCIVSANEVDALLKNPTLRGVVSQFAQKDEVWRDAFQSAFTRMIDSNFRRLRVYGTTG